MLRLRIDIPLWPGGLRKAVTFSFDDGIEQDKRFIRLLDQYGLKSTFNLNSGLFGNRDELHQEGLDVHHYKLDGTEIEKTYCHHEIAVHSLTHMDLTKVPLSTVIYEVTRNKKQLEDLVEHPVCGMAYPFGTTNENIIRVLKECGIKYARTVESTHGFNLPEDFMRWNPSCYYRDTDALWLAKDFVECKYEEAQYDQLKLFYVWGHTYEFDGRFHWERIEKMLSILSGRKDIWYATNMEIAEYVEAQKSLIYSADGAYIFNPSRMNIWMLIDQNICEIPSGKTVKISYQRKDYE